MSIFKKPEERAPRTTISMMIYGMPGTGKTTLACSAPNAVLLDFENGQDRIHYQHRVPSVTPTTWMEVNQALDEIAQTPEIESIVVDSIDRLMTLAMEQVRATNPTKCFNSDGTPNLKGYGARKQLYQDFVRRCKAMNKNVIYVAHVVEEKRTVGSSEVTVFRPNISKSNAPDITTDLDMEGYMTRNGGTIEITYDPDGKNDIECKNSFGIHGAKDPFYKAYKPRPVAIVVDDKGVASANTYITDLIRWNTARLMRQWEESKATTAEEPKKATRGRKTAKNEE